LRKVSRVVSRRDWLPRKKNYQSVRSAKIRPRQDDENDLALSSVVTQTLVSPDKVVTINEYLGKRENTIRGIEITDLTCK